MAYHLIESWKTFPAGYNDMIRRWTYQYGNGGQIVSNGCQINGNQVSYCNTHFTVASEMMMGFWFTPYSYAPSTVNMSFLHLLNGGETNSSNQLGFGLNPNGTLAVFQGANFSNQGGTTLFNGTTVLALNTRYWIELHIITDPTNGVFEVRINGIQECNLTGINSSPTGSNGLTGMSLCGGANTLHTFGGLYVGDGTEGFLGPCEVERLYPVGWTSEANPNYTVLDNLFDAAHYSDPGGATSPLQGPSYNPATIHAIQATRFVTPGSTPAYFAMNKIEGPIPSGGLTGYTDALYFDALLSKAIAAPVRNGVRRKYGGRPG